MEHLPVLQVVLPLLAAPVCVLLRNSMLTRLWATAATWCAAVIAILQVGQVLGRGPISYYQGGWPPPWGIEYRVDLLAAFVMLVVTCIASVTIPIGLGINSHSVDAKREPLFYALFLLCLSGLLGMTSTGDAFNVFVFLEISSLATYGLVSLGRSRRALTAALNYLFMGTVGGTCILIGIGLMYQMTGTLNMGDLHERLPLVMHTRTIPVAFAFLVMGFAIKLAMFPVHQWLPNAYAFAPSPVSAFVAGTATKVIYYLMIRFIFSIFGGAFVFGKLGFDQLLVVVSVIAMFTGSIAAIFQRNIKRLLAYSSVAQIGYLTLALSLASEAGVTAGLVHLFNHALMKSGMFLAVACLVARLGSADLSVLKGNGRSMPWTMTALIVGGFGLIGVPGTAGFVSKWYLVVAALEQESYLIAALILASSLLAVVYVWKIIETAFFQKPDDSTEPVRNTREAPTHMLLPAGVLAIAVLYFGVFTEWPVSLSSAAANALFGGAS